MGKFNLKQSEVKELKELSDVFEYEEIECCDDGIWFAKGIEEKNLISRELENQYSHLNHNVYLVKDLLSYHNIIDEKEKRLIK